MMLSICFYEREVPSMSKANSLKNGKNVKNTFFSVFPFACFYRKADDFIF